jgi:hypothetical protein
VISIVFVFFGTPCIQIRHAYDFSLCFLRELLMSFLIKTFYNIAFVNSERWLAKSRVDITQCQHGNVGTFLSLYFFVLYYETNIKLFSVLIYSYINTCGKWENSKLCENIPPFGRRVSTQFLVFPISTRVDIIAYQHGKCFIFVNCHAKWLVFWKKAMKPI